MNALGFVGRMAWREARGSARGLVVPTAAVAVGVAALVAIDAFTAGVLGAVRGQARELLGADVAVSSAADFPPAAEPLLGELRRAAGEGGDARVTSLSAMALAPGRAGARLVQLTAVERGYPFYGTVQSEPTDVWSRLAGSNAAVVEASLLPALGIEVGDEIAIGDARFPVLGTIATFPGDAAIRAVFGPRVFVSAHRLPDTGLVVPGSRVRYETFFRLPATVDGQALADRLRPKLAEQRINVRTVADDQDRLRQTLGRLGRYLGLVALLALLLGGIGVASAMHVFVKRRTESVAVLRCLGADARLVLGVYLGQAAVVGFVGSLAGAGVGLLASRLLPRLAKDFLPVDLSFVLPPPWSAASGAAFGFACALAFAAIPILALRRIPPLLALRRDVDGDAPVRRDRAVVLAASALALLLTALSMWEARSASLGLAFALGIAAALGVLYLVSWSVTRALRGVALPTGLPYLWRQGIANLHRPANQTATVVLALGFGAFLLTTLLLVQHNLLRELRTPGGTRPNLVFFDVQPDQRETLLTLVREAGAAVTAEAPVVPMRIQAIKGRPVVELLGQGDAEEIRGRWALRREYRSSYRDAVGVSEEIVAGRLWDPGASAGDVSEVSLERSVARELEVGIGDSIDWDVQGVTVRSRVTSLREVRWSSFSPNFFAIFPTSALEGAPQTFAVLARLEGSPGRARLQRETTEKLPNVSSIDATAVQESLDGVIGKAAAAIRFMALFTLVAGAAVLLGAVAASRYQRVREGVLLRTLGATRSQVARILAAEYASLGLLSVLVATGLALAAALALTRFVFETRLEVPWPPLLGLAAGVTAMTVVIGLLASVPAFRGTPIEVLRAE